MLGYDKVSYKVQIIEHLTNLQALNGLGLCKVVMLKVRYQGGMAEK